MIKSIRYLLAHLLRRKRVIPAKSKEDFSSLVITHPYYERLD